MGFVAMNVEGTGKNGDGGRSTRWDYGRARVRVRAVKVGGHGERWGCDKR